MPSSDCRKTSISIIVPIKSADKFEYEQSKGTLYLAKRPLLKNSPLGCFINSPLRNAPSLENFAHCDERPKALPLETASIFEKLLDQKTFIFKISKDFFDKLKLFLKKA